MLEEKMDNLDATNQNSDGNENTTVQPQAATTTNENSENENSSPTVVTNQQLQEDILVVQTNEKDKAAEAIADSNAEESEDETLKGRHDIPMEDYDTFSMEKLVETLEKLVATEKLMSVKDHIEEIKKAFFSKFNHFIEEKREEFNLENTDPNQEFEYHFPLKEKIDNLYNQFRNQRNKHYKSLQTNLEENLKVRTALVEELKNLIQSQDPIGTSLKQLNDIRERWKHAGPIPKDKYNHVWNNYHFHIENFYDVLHLDREARDMDFKHNLDLKLKIIARVEELSQEEDSNAAFRELQDLHRIWKEEIGPVSRDKREEIWDRFSELTKIMHDKREVYFDGLRAKEGDNLNKKKEIIAQLAVLSKEKVENHQAWLNQIVKVETLREHFFSTGKVPAEVNEQTWTEFKTEVRNFNILKNSFYKDIKKDQNANLQHKQDLVNKANELKNSEDFEATTQQMKQIQEDWKKIGHVPRKFSDALWNEFRAACNHYFERLKNNRKEDDTVEIEAYENKKKYMETVRAFEMTGDHKTDLDAIKKHIELWKSFGRVPSNKRHIEGKFNKILDALFEKLSLSKKDTDKMRFANKLDTLSDNSRGLDNERIFIQRKMEELQNEIFQLENNIQFFQNTKNAKKENSIVIEVRKNIAKHKEEFESWKDKLKQLREFKSEND